MAQRDPTGYYPSDPPKPLGAICPSTELWLCSILATVVVIIILLLKVPAESRRTLSRWMERKKRFVSWSYHACT
jgi:hypothetical protein